MARRALVSSGRLALCAILALGCGACGLDWDAPATQPARKSADATAKGRYTVKSGDTLYSIAFRFGLDQRELARWNNLRDATLIYPGQRLRLTAPPAGSSTTNATRRTASTTVRSAPVTPRNWAWPTRGRVVSQFNLNAQVARTGVLIGGQRGQPVLAADSGEVVYSGGGLKGYGKLIIIRHDVNFLSAYGHNAALLVAEGERVKRGQKIATMGDTASKQPRLHFEVRQSGKPIDPLPLLPKQ
ncbi:MAG: peptidoglycan DD-metalloendopeptidase family protein [Pseudomonadota bacterium]